MFWQLTSAFFTVYTMCMKVALSLDNLLPPVQCYLWAWSTQYRWGVMHKYLKFSLQASSFCLIIWQPHVTCMHFYGIFSMQYICMYVCMYAIFCECQFEVIFDVLERYCLIHGKWLDLLSMNTLSGCMEWNSVKVRRCLYKMNCVLEICLNCVAWRSWRRWLCPSPKRTWLIGTCTQQEHCGFWSAQCTIAWCSVLIYLYVPTYVCMYVYPNTLSTLVSCTHCRCSVT